MEFPLPARWNSPAMESCSLLETDIAALLLAVLLVHAEPGAAPSLRYDLSLRSQRPNITGKGPITSPFRSVHLLGRPLGRHPPHVRCARSMTQILMSRVGGPGHE